MKKGYSVFLTKMLTIVPNITILLFAILVSSAFSANVERASVASNGTQGNSHSGGGSVSADGRFIAFASEATNLVPGDTNFYSDIFVRDRVTGETTRITKGFDGSQANGNSGYAAISANGRYVAFESWASNLVPNDTNNTHDVFVYDRQNGTTTRVSVSSSGGQADNVSHYPCISATGRFIAFQSWAVLSGTDQNGREDVYVHDFLTGETSLVSVSSTGAGGDDGSGDAFISADGRYVGFQSYAANLVPGDTNGATDVFIHDRLSGETVRVSVASNRTEANGHSAMGSLSADGRFATFTSNANNLVTGDTGTTDPMYGSGDDVFVHDMITGETTRVSVDPDGLQLDYGAQTGSVGEIYSSLSADGRYVAFESRASNVVPGDSNGTVDVFVRDRTLGQTVMLSAAANGTAGNDQSFPPFISADGRTVVFSSLAENIVANDTNLRSDVFVATLPTTPAPFVIASPPLLKFGTVAFSQSASQSISFMNLGSAVLTFGTISTGGNDSADFIIQSDTCSGQELTPAASCTVVIRINPQSPLPESAVLRVPSNAANNVLLQVPLSGSRGPAPDSYAYAAPLHVDFGDVAASTLSSTQSVTIGNAGSRSFTLGSLALEGPDASQFRLLSDGCSGLTLAPGAGCPVLVQFQPDALWAKSCTLSVPSSAANAPLIQVTLSGSGKAPTPAAVETTIRASVATDGTQGNNMSYHPALSADGRFVIFESKATNLVPGDTNQAPDFFVRDLLTGTTSRVSIASDGSQAIAPSNPLPWASISADGRYTAFTSGAVNLVDNDGNVENDIFVHDSQTGATVRASVSSDGAETDDSSHMPKLSGNGRYVAFQSSATNLASPQTARWNSNIYVRNLDTGQTVLVSKASDSTYGNSGSYNPSISSDGRYVAFDSLAMNLVSGDTNESPGLIGSGRDVYVRDLQTNQTTRVSLANDGSEANGHSQYPSISGDGRYVAFESQATNLGTTIPSGVTQIFVRDRVAGTTTLISRTTNSTPGDNDSYSPSISSDGRFVAFESSASNLGGAFGAFNIYVHDRITGQTRWFSKSSEGTAGNGMAYLWSSSVISADGRTVVFNSFGADFAENDTNGEFDVFVHNLGDTSLSIWPRSFSFDGVPADNPLVETFTITNTISSNVTVGTLYLGGPDSRHFLKLDDMCSGKVLVPDESCTVGVKFAPDSAGIKQARLMVPTFVTSFAMGSAMLTGTGNSSFSVSPRLVSFESTPVGVASSARTLTIANNGSLPIDVTMTLVGVNASEFVIVDDQCAGLTLASHSTCTVQVQFVPTLTGSSTGALSVQWDGSFMDVDLAGIALNPDTGTAGPGIALTSPATAIDISDMDSYTIDWTATEPGRDPVISLYYDLTGSGYNGTLIATNIRMSDPSRSYAWNTSGLPDGTYYFYAKITDGTNDVYAYAPGSLIRNVHRGDVNDDGDVRVDDALAVMRLVLGLSSGTQAELRSADVAPLVNGKPQPDGRIDLSDVIVILRRAIGLTNW